MSASSPHTSPDLLGSDHAWARAFVESAVDAIVAISDAGIIQYFNPAAENLFGYSADKAVGQNVNILMPEPDQSNHDSYIQRYLNEGSPRIIGIGREVVARREDGTLFPAYLSVCETRIDSNRVFIGHVHDISALHHALDTKDEALHALNKRNVELACMYRVGHAIRSNEPLDDIFRDMLPLIIPAFEFSGDIAVRISLDDVEVESENFQESSWRISAPIEVAGRVRGSIDVFYREEHPERDHGSFSEPEWRLIQAVASAMGETIERREAEAQVYNASKLASVGELAAGVSHEINNPINGIVNCADILLTMLAEDSPEREYAGLIRSEAERITKIVRSLLTFAGHDREALQNARLEDIVGSVLNLCQKRIAHSHVQLQVEIPSELPEMRCRPHELQQVLMNLIINGLHALDSRFPEADPEKKLRLAAATHGEGDISYLRVTVEDRGIGIANSYRQRIFDPFFTTKGRDKGTGLGLSVSNGIVKKHGGRLEVESELGRGSAFHVILPLDPDRVMKDSTGDG